jgi:hypothetical protein
MREDDEGGKSYKMKVTAIASSLHESTSKIAFAEPKSRMKENARETALE